jgi:hypothetical protein
MFVQLNITIWTQIIPQFYRVFLVLRMKKMIRKGEIIVFNNSNLTRWGFNP